MMFDQETAVGLATKLVEAGIEVDVSVRHNPDPQHTDEPSPTAWSVRPKVPILDLAVVVRIAAGYELVAWIGHAGAGPSSVDFKRKV